MEKIDLKERLEKEFPEYISEDKYGLPCLTVSRENLKEVASRLQNKDTFNFNMLVCETAVDRADKIELVYHLRSLPGDYQMIVKSETDRDNGSEIDSVTFLWESAGMFENEIFDLFGVKFIGHPNLKRVILEEDFIGYPLRKDFVNTNVEKY